MKTGEDFRREFPGAEEGFGQAVDRALDKLHEKRYGAIDKPRTAALLTAVLLLVATVAFAATVDRWGIREFTENSPFANLSDEAIKALAADFEEHVIDTDYATLVVTEAVYDGMAVYLLMEVTPRIEGYMLVPTSASEDTPAYTCGSSYPGNVTIHEYAKQLSYDGVMAIETMGSETTAHMYDSAINEDGTYCFMLWAYVQPEYRELPQLELHLKPVVWHGNREIARFESALTIPLVGEVEHAVSAEGESVAFDNAGIVITGVEAVRTPMSTYIMVRFDKIDETRYLEYRRYSTLRLLDEKGGLAVKGAHPLSLWIDQAYQRMGDETYYITNRIFAAMPEQITIGEYDGNHADGWTEGQTYTFHLQ